MSIRVSGVYLVPGQVCEKTGNTVNGKTVAIVAPQRSTSLDYLNFEQRRQIIASSLSLSEFLSCGTNKEGVTTVFVGECTHFCYNCRGRRIRKCINNIYVHYKSSKIYYIRTILLH